MPRYTFLAGAAIKELRNEAKEIIEEVKEEINNSMEAAYDRTQLEVPVKTGALKASGKVDVENRGGVTTYSLIYGNDDVDYAEYINSGLPNKKYYKFMDIITLNEVDKLLEKLGAE